MSSSRLSRHNSSGVSDDASSVYSGASFTSSYRHHNTGPFMPYHPASSPPQPVLTADAKHVPKTTGSTGIMIVGLGGANGTTLLAGILANRLQLHWHGAKGEPMSCNYYGCITQLELKGGGVGYRNRVRGLADASMAAIGGWDIRPTKPGDALLRDQILDYDLVRQLLPEMNKVKVFRGLYDPRFIGTSQHDTATHVLDSTKEAKTTADALKCLRADLRYFKWRNGVVGHTTVIWSASVEPNCDEIVQLATAADLLDALDATETERGYPLPPSLVYATAALLEGCSFINGGSQNTLACPGLLDLARQQVGVYCLGTDFKAGQTKFKTAATEYLRTIGLVPMVIASANHLGNNDMKNLASSPATTTAKLRVKHDIFAPWQEDQLDHKVAIMYTPYINDEKRDYVEYTSLGFLGQVHTMVTYTRASDSVLCVPLLIDGAVWCDYFAAASWPYDKVARALAYLFKVPEGSAQGVDPGFFKQMAELEKEVLAVNEHRRGHRREGTGGQFSGAKKKVRIRSEEKTTEWAIPHDARIVCAGLACVDMQLNQATGGNGGETIESFEGEISIGGGSVSMACKTLARLCHGAPLDEHAYMQVTPPCVHSVIPLCKVGMDSTGDRLISLLEKCGEACRNVDTKYLKAARTLDPDGRTALAVLPIYKDGRRGCFFDAASNMTFSANEMVGMIRRLSPGSSGPTLDTSTLSENDLESYHIDLELMTPVYGAFLFGYPHLLPNMQGEALAQVFLEAKTIMIEGGVIALDLNGVPESPLLELGQTATPDDLLSDTVIGAALGLVDILHMNEDEACLLTGFDIRGTPGFELNDEMLVAKAADLFIECGVAIVVITRGNKGSFVRCSNADRFRRANTLPASWADCSAKVGCVELPEDAILNGNGAGDSFLAGFLVASMLRHTGMTVPANEPDSPKKDTSSYETPVSSPRTAKKKLTPYSLYMREHYLSLKAQLNDDKKAIFSRCHEMWENETDDVRNLYERRAFEENEVDNNDNEMSIAMETLDSTLKVDTVLKSEARIVSSPRNLYMTNRSLNLESAVQFASLVAAFHVDTATRDRTHVDVGNLLDRAMIVSSRLEEI